MNKIKIFELFSGYGGASFALKKANIPFECVGFSEINKYAIQCYKQNHGDIKNFGDITKINPNEIPDFDLLTGGFPCQAFSIAGKRKGKRDSRGTLFWEIMRIAEVKKPKYMILENVKGLLSIDNGETFKEILRTIRKSGYDVIYKVLNSKEHGIPQNRERIIFVCKYGKWDFMEFMFPEKEKLKLTMKDILEKEFNNKYYLSEKQLKMLLENERHSNEMLYDSNVANTLCARDYKDGGKRIKLDDIQIADFRYDEGIRIRKEGNSPTLCSTMKNNNLSTIPIIIHSLFPRTGNPDYGGTGHLKKNDGTSYCIDTNNCQAIQYTNKFRRLTPKECFRLMGFLNDEINLEQLSDTQCYKLAGNGWDINLFSKIFKCLFRCEICQCQ